MIGLAAIGIKNAQPALGAPLEYHVATTGDDSGPGSAEQPFATLPRAQQAVRAATAGMQSDIIVNLHAGTYSLTAPLQLSDAAGDSGQNGHRVIYQAYGYGTTEPAAVTLSGGRAITGWQRDSKITWRANVGDLDTRQLYVNGKRATRARLATGAPIGLPGHVTQTATGYVTNSTIPQSWQNPTDIELVHHARYAELLEPWYTEQRCGVAGISGDAKSTTITMDQPCHRLYRQTWTFGLEGAKPSTPQDPTGLVASSPTWVENGKNFLTEPGTFYLDRAQPGQHVLYYIPRQGENLANAEAIAPVLEKLVDGNGTSSAPIHDIAVRGLTFSYSTWLGPGEPTGFVHVFGPIYELGDTAQFNDAFDSSESARTMPGAVRFQHAQRIGIEDNRFSRMGADAIELTFGIAQSMIKGNLITDVSGGGIQLASRQPDTNLDNDNPDNVIENNLVHDIGIEYRGSVGIWVEKTQRALVAHNQVNNVPYTGIFFGEHYDGLSGPDPRAEPTYSSDNRILNNHVFNTVQFLMDGAGIATASNQGTSYENGTVVAGNHVHDFAAHGTTQGIGFYPDDYASFVTWRDNVVYGMGDRGTVSGAPLAMRITNNFLEAFDPTPNFWGLPSYPEVIYENNVPLERGNAAPACQAIPACAAITANAGLEPRYRRLLDET